MQLILLLLLGITVCFCKINSRALTESMGQEVIEIGAPIKELPLDLEEEPAAENDDDKVTSTTIQVATKKDIKKITTTEALKKAKDIDIIDGSRRDDDEARIEKELADIYKDSADYKADSAEVTKEVNSTTENAEKPIGRARNSFKFQPDSNNPREIARFRTSIDEISCEKANKLSGVTTTPTSGCQINVPEKIIYLSIFCLFSGYYIKNI